VVHSVMAEDKRGGERESCIDGIVHVHSSKSCFTLCLVKALCFLDSS